MESVPLEPAYTEGMGGDAGRGHTEDTRGHLMEAVLQEQLAQGHRPHRRLEPTRQPSPPARTQPARHRMRPGPARPGKYPAHPC
jgi:hypothetical protein